MSRVWSIVAAACIMTLGVTSAARAEDRSLAPHAGTWYVQVGRAGVDFNSSATVQLAGRAVPGAGARALNNITLGVGAGYFFTRNLSVDALLGSPPETTIHGNGALAGLSAGKVTYGPAILAIDYHFTRFGAFQPFIGAGVNYTVVLGHKDLAISGLKVDNAWGTVVRAGFNAMVTRHVGVFSSVQKVFVGTKVSGTFNGLPVSANVTLDPWIYHAGLTYRF